MTHFKIAGTPDCPFFGHALHVGYFLADKLPNFNLIRLEIEPNKWKQWLRKTNVKNGWHHSNSPLIWKELTKSGGKPHYIGGLSEFWEYCYDYYNLESILSKHDLQKIVDDSLQYFHSEEKRKMDAPKPLSMKILVMGGSERMVWLFLSELIDLEHIKKQKFLTIHIYSKVKLEMEEFDVDEFQENILEMAAHPVLNVQVIQNLETGLVDCNLFVLFGDYTRQENEDFKTWLDRNSSSMLQIADHINRIEDKKAPDFRIILALHGPVCFDATILAEYCTNIDKSEIVAVTADVGLETLNVLSKETKTPIANLSGPPVWGFVGINHIIDIDHIIEIHDVYRPYNRALKLSEDSTLVSGRNHTELRFFCYKTYDLKDIWRKVVKFKKEIHKRLDGPTMLPKIRATISLIENWYAEPESDNILCLGIICDGQSILENLCYSLPVRLRHGKWEHFQEFPKPIKDICKTEDFLPFIYEILAPYIGHGD